MKVGETNSQYRLRKQVDQGSSRVLDQSAHADGTDLTQSLPLRVLISLPRPYGRGYSIAALRAHGPVRTDQAGGSNFPDWVISARLKLGMKFFSLR